MISFRFNRPPTGNLSYYADIGKPNPARFCRRIPPRCFALSRLERKALPIYCFSVSSSLKMVVCGGCWTKNFNSGELAPMQTIPCSKCGHPVMLPFQMRQFELRSVIAAGGMGMVFRAFDLNLERELAIKLVKREIAADPQVMASFYREARASAAL